MSNIDRFTNLKNKALQEYEIDKALTPINRNNGNIENVMLSDLRKHLDFCFLDLDNHSFQEYLIEYIEDYTVELSTQIIPSRKEKIKNLKKILRSKEIQLDKLNLNDKRVDELLDEVNNLNFEFQQEKYILNYLKEQRFLLRGWYCHKWQEIKSKPLEEWVQSQKDKKSTTDLLNRIRSKSQNIVITKDHHFYCQIGGLFAQNFIKKERAKDRLNSVYLYKNKEFINPNQLAKYIKKDILNTKRSVNQYVRDTLNDNDTPHNLYKSRTKLLNIIKYCKESKIPILNDKIKLDI